MHIQGKRLARRGWLQWLSAMSLGFWLISASAQSPQTVRLVVGYSAGGPVDAAARLIAPALARELGQNVVVENRKINLKLIQWKC